jgi:ATP-binding cassette subfamily B protein
MTVTEEHTDDDTPKVDLTAPDTRAAGRWNSAGMPTERSDQFGMAVRRLGSLLRPERPILVVVLLTAMLSAFLNVLGPRVLGWGTDVIIDGIQSPAGIDIGRLHDVLLLAIGLYVTSAVLSVGTAWLIAGVVQRLMRRLRAQAEAKVHALTLRHIDKQARGDLLSRVTNDLDNLAQSLQ